MVILLFKSMPGILKVGMTERNPEIRLNEANSSDTWRPPTPYKIEFAKKVLNPKQKETTLHNLLSQYTERINPKREFFRVSLEEVKTFFDLIDGDLWDECPEEEEEEERDQRKYKLCNENKIKIVIIQYEFNCYNKQKLETFIADAVISLGFEPINSIKPFLTKSV